MEKRWTSGRGWSSCGIGGVLSMVVGCVLVIAVSAGAVPLVVAICGVGIVLVVLGGCWVTVGVNVPVVDVC